MLLSAIFAAIPASAAEAEKAAIDFTKLDYVNRDWKSKIGRASCRERVCRMV